MPTGLFHVCDEGMQCDVRDATRSMYEIEHTPWVVSLDISQAPSNQTSRTTPMHTLHASEILDPLTMCTMVIAMLATAVRQLTKLIQSLNKMLPKSFWRKLAKALHQAIQYFIKEITPPNPSPIVTKVINVVFAAIFYVLVLDCTCLMIIDIIQIWSSDAVAWKKLLGTAVLTIIAFNWRFCLNQGEKLRKELKATSRVLW